MLIRFEVENFRSIVEPAELSMVAVDDRPEVRIHPKFGASLVPVAGIFGPNASGKSNVLAALAWLRSAVRHSLRGWDDEIPVEPFAFGDRKSQDSSFALELEIGGIRFEYLLDVGRHRVSYEALFHYPEGRKRRVFEREANELVLQRGLGELAGTRTLLTDRSLALSIMRRFDEPTTSAFARTLLRITAMGQPLSGLRRSPARTMHSTLRLFDPPREGDFDDALPGETEFDEQEWQSTRRHAIALLQLADLGVADVEIEETRIESERSGTVTRRVPQLVHVADKERLPFEYQHESAGTQAWFELIGPVLMALRSGAVILFDELDASLHPTLTARLVELFKGHKSNPHGAQLVFTSHDTNLLNHLNRDEVWLTQKESNGSTRFAALSDFAGERVRRSANLESGYLSGRFGALPDVSRLDVLQDLGLIG
ncbi:AAA family ATPase [Nocardia bovistercoris]|uniref:AAA family ATPase n=1 Tax=Nocardia bovistercoris TaxID=2785916 RepID=A0A931IAE0_9NOCA|nr:ATP-binding protein [Nocardia bovistercoris]MBH0776820.1 AAA family ATPase [Nocardia bovistercoris]MBH0781198.1 AAA family ATPase [Nocardia bovistercoris]